MVNIVDVIVPIIVGVIIVAVSIYLFTIYCHRTPLPIQPNNDPSATSPPLKY